MTGNADDARLAKSPGLPVIRKPLNPEALAKVEIRRTDPFTQYALIASREAWADAGTPEVDPERLGELRPDAHLGAIRIAPSRRMVSPFR